MAKNTSILLGEYFEGFITHQLKSGKFSSASEVVRAALRMYEYEESKKAELINELKKSEKSGFIKKSSTGIRFLIKFMKKIYLDKLIASLFLALTILFVVVSMTNTSFFDWVFDRHHNQWSWYLRPIFLIPFCFFAYKRTWAGISITVFCLFTSMFWFNKPEVVSESVSSFLQFEKDWLYGEWDFKKIMLIITVPISFFALGFAFWKRSLAMGIAVVVLMATGKMIWSVQNAGEAGHSVIVPASIGLLICCGLIYVGFKRLSNTKP